MQCSNVFLSGPAGSGKTTVAEQVAHGLEKALGCKIPFYFTGAVNSEYKLMGFVKPDGEVVRTAFREAFENGGVFLFDEIDGSSANAILAFNAALAGSLCDFPDGTVKKHANFYCIAAGNTFGQGATREYVGRNPLDAASLDRFAFIDFGYDEDLERHIAGNDNWTSYVQSVRAAVVLLKIRAVVTPRASITGAKLLAAGEEVQMVKMMVIFKGMDAEMIRKIEANVPSHLRVA